MSLLQIRIEKGLAGTVTLGLKGNVDIHSYDELEKTLEGLLAEGFYNLEVNLSKVGYMGSAGIGIFLHILQTVQAKKGTIKLINPQPIVRKALTLLEASHFFTIG